MGRAAPPLNAGPHGGMEMAVNVVNAAEIYRFRSEGRYSDHKQTG